MEEGRKTPRTIAHSHGSKNLPSDAACVAHHLGAAHHPTKPEPQHRLPPMVPLRAAPAWRAAGRETGQEASEELPATSQVQQHSPAHHRHQKTTGFLGFISTSSSRSTSPPAPHQGSFLWAVSCKIQDRRRTSWPQTRT